MEFGVLPKPPMRRKKKPDVAAASRSWPEVYRDVAKRLHAAGLTELAGEAGAVFRGTPEQIMRALVGSELVELMSEPMRGLSGKERLASGLLGDWSQRASEIRRRWSGAPARLVMLLRELSTVAPRAVSAYAPHREEVQLPISKPADKLLERVGPGPIILHELVHHIAAADELRRFRNWARQRGIPARFYHDLVKEEWERAWNERKMGPLRRLYERAVGRPPADVPEQFLNPTEVRPYWREALWRWAAQRWPLNEQFFKVWRAALAGDRTAAEALAGMLAAGNPVTRFQVGLGEKLLGQQRGSWSRLAPWMAFPLSLMAAALLSGLSRESGVYHEQA